LDKCTVYIFWAEDSSKLKEEALGSSEMSVNVDQTTQLHIPEDGIYFTVTAVRPSNRTYLFSNDLKSHIFFNDFAVVARYCNYIFGTAVASVPTFFPMMSER
jgi:hypothetical protein